MKFRKKHIILSLILIILSLSCEKEQKDQKVINSKDYSEVSEVDLANKNIEIEEYQNIMYSALENPALTNSYDLLLSGYKLENFPDMIHESYSEFFLDKDNNFIIPSEEKINSFLSDDIGTEYENLIGIGAAKVRKEQSKDRKYRNKELDESANEFIKSIEERIKIINETKNYYKKKEYKKDNFAKGKSLYEKYLKNYKELQKNYEKFYWLWKKERYIITKNTISVLKYKADRILTYNILKISLLCEMFSDKFYGSKLYIDTSKPFVIEENDKEKYVNELKSIQKTFDNIISDMKKIDSSQMSQENISSEDFKNLLQKVDEISKHTKSIIEKIETGKNEEVNEMISEYVRKVESLDLGILIK